MSVTPQTSGSIMYPLGGLGGHVKPSIRYPNFLKPLPGSAPDFWFFSAGQLYIAFLADFV